MKKFPLVAEAMINRHNVYNQQLEYVAEMEKQGLAYVIQPLTPLDCPTLEKNTVKLESIYQLGYSHGLKHIEGVKAFLND